MPYITNLTLSNQSLQFSYGAYTDINIFLLFLVGGIILLILSQILKKDIVSGVIPGLIAILALLASTWMSLSVARIEMISAASSTVTNLYENNTEMINYVYPIVQSMYNPALTIFCVLMLIISILSLLDIVFTHLQNLDRVELNKKWDKKRGYI
jgi:hypothetical protein